VCSAPDCPDPTLPCPAQALAEKARAQSRDVTSDVVVEEVFENERFQPFRCVALYVVSVLQACIGFMWGVERTGLGRARVQTTRNACM